MKLIEMKMLHGPSIWVNPALIATVEPTGDGATIYFAAVGSEDAVMARTVAIPADKVAEQVNAVLRGG